MTRAETLVPPRCAGMRIGLMGGSFDPAHAGHRHCADVAIARLNLHAVWWLVSPQNPLKPKSSPLPHRLESARAMAGRHPLLRVSALETVHNLVFSVDTIGFLKRASPGVQFVWIMGADSMGAFHRWRRWRVLANTVPIFIAPRPGANARIRNAKAFAILASRRVPPERLLWAALPAWSLSGGPVNPLSSTQLRLGGGASRPNQTA